MNLHLQSKSVKSRDDLEKCSVFGRIETPTENSMREDKNKTIIKFFPLWMILTSSSLPFHLSLLISHAWASPSVPESPQLEASFTILYHSEYRLILKTTLYSQAWIHKMNLLGQDGTIIQMPSTAIFETNLQVSVGFYRHF